MFRRKATETALVAWRAPRDHLRAVLGREGIPAALGPERDGWTVARVLVNDEEVVEPRERRVLDLVDDLARSLGAPGAASKVGEWGARLIVVCSGDAVPVEAVLPPLTAAEPPDRSGWAGAMRALGTLDRLEAVLDAATLDQPVTKADRTAAEARDNRPVRVAAAAGLPAELLEPGLAGAPEPYREVVVCRDRAPDDPGMSAAVLKMPLRVLDLPDLTVVTADPVGGIAMRPVAAGIATGRRSALVLWRQGDVRGYVLVRRGEAEDAHHWTASWDVVGLPADRPDLADELRAALEPPEGDAELLVRRLGTRGEVTATEVRTALRRPPGPDVVAGLCALLGVDPVAAAVLEGTADLADDPRSVRVEPVHPLRVVFTGAAREPRPTDGWLRRAAYRRTWWYRLAQIVFAVAAAGVAIDSWGAGGPARIWSAVLGILVIGALADAVLPGREPPG
jgi:hypothetical protein